MSTQIDLLQIKIEKAKGELSPETLNAIDAVDWKNVILGLRQSKGYSFEQLGDLEIETELLLCGLLSSNDYPKELEAKMKIPKAQVNDLVNEMNQLVFSRIREEFIKLLERRKSSTRNNEQPENAAKIKPPEMQIKRSEEFVLSKAGIKINPTPLNLAQKLTSSFQTPSIKTEHTIANISKAEEAAVKVAPSPVQTGPIINIISSKPLVNPKVMADIKPAPESTTKDFTATYKNKDPYRISPNE